MDARKQAWIRERAVGLINGWFEYVRSTTDIKDVQEIIGDGGVSRKDADLIIKEAQTLIDGLIGGK